MKLTPILSGMAAGIAVGAIASAMASNAMSSPSVKRSVKQAAHQVTNTAKHVGEMFWVPVAGRHMCKGGERGARCPVPAFCLPALDGHERLHFIQPARSGAVSPIQAESMRRRHFPAYRSAGKVRFGRAAPAQCLGTGKTYLRRRAQTLLG